MANYNHNKLTIRGAETLIAEIKTKIITINEAGEDTFSFHSIIPQDISQGSWANSDIWGTRTDADDYGTLDLEIKKKQALLFSANYNKILIILTLQSFKKSLIKWSNTLLITSL